MKIRMDVGSLLSGIRSIAGIAILGCRTLLLPLICLLVGSTGCESTDGGGSSANTAVYYGAGYYDPWYYGPGYCPPDDVCPPPTRPEAPPHVENPIVVPPAAPPRPMPSIPSAPRPSFRR
jgi:hypothetical protein